MREASGARGPRSSATRPRRSAPDASRSRQAPARTSGGTFYPTRRSGLWRIPQLRRLDRLPRGSPSPMEDLHLSTDPPAAPPTHNPRIAPGRSPNAPFGQTAAAPRANPFACPIRRTAQGRGRIDRKASRHERRPDPPSRPFYPHERTRTGGGRRPDDLAPPCGRQSPADCTSGSGDPRFSRSSLGCTEVQPKEPKHSAIRRLRVPWLP